MTGISQGAWVGGRTPRNLNKRGVVKINHLHGKSVKAAVTHVVGDTWGSRAGYGRRRGRLLIFSRLFPPSQAIVQPNRRYDKKRNPGHGACPRSTAKSNPPIICMVPSGSIVN